MKTMIRAGKPSQVTWGAGNWIFLDVGFSNQKRTCGLIIGNDPPMCVRFSDAVQLILKGISESKEEINLLIEAPLSVCFSSDGNPKGRAIENCNGQTRYWYVGLGCSVMVAATYVIREIQDAAPRIPINLFEGFVSYKEKGKKSDHALDVRLLKEVVQQPNHFRDSIIAVEEFRLDPQDKLVSAFAVSGLNCGIPTVIRRRVSI